MNLLKSAKKTIKAILSTADVTDEELQSAFVGAEALINSQPLIYQSDDPTDDIPLTPNHFLVGQLGGKFSPEIIDDAPYNPRKQWRRVQELIRHFWGRWLKEWLPALNARSKWRVERDSLKIGDIVLILSQKTPRAHWPLGRIVNVHPGLDGRVRVVTVHSGTTRMKRPITHLCPLEL